MSDSINTMFLKLVNNKEIHINNNETYLFALSNKYYNISLVHYLYFKNCLKIILQIKNLKFDIKPKNINKIIKYYDEIIKYYDNIIKSKNFNNDKILKMEIMNTFAILNQYKPIINTLIEYKETNDENCILKILNMKFFIMNYSKQIDYSNISMHKNIKDIVLFNLFFLSSNNEYNIINKIYKNIFNEELTHYNYNNAINIFNNFYKNLKNDIINNINIYNKDNNFVSQNSINELNNFKNDMKDYIDSNLKILDIKDLDTKLTTVYDNINYNVNMLYNDIKNQQTLIYENINLINKAYNTFIENIDLKNKKIVYTYIKSFSNDIILGLTNNKLKNVDDETSSLLKKLLSAIVAVLTAESNYGGCINNKCYDSNLCNMINKTLYYNFNKLFNINDKNIIVYNNYFNVLFKLITIINYKIITFLQNDDGYIIQKIEKYKNIFNKIICPLDINNLNIDNFEKYYINFIKKSNIKSINDFINTYNFDNEKINSIINELIVSSNNFEKKIVYINELNIFDKLIKLYTKINNTYIFNDNFLNFITFTQNNKNNFIFKNYYIININNISDIINNLFFNLYYKINNRTDNINYILINNYKYILYNINTENINLSNNYFNNFAISHDLYNMYLKLFYTIKNLNKKLLDKREYFYIKYAKIHCRIKIIIYKNQFLKENIIIYNKILFYYTLKLLIYKNILENKNIKLKSLLNICKKYY